nr:hypothetical protein L204_04032 [Cryptococcus depauperatus CBS 7855]
MSTYLVQTVTLNDGNEIPVIAFGTGTKLAWTDTSKAVNAALKAGYRHIDCAWHYKNQHHTGRALKESGIEREGLFLSTKGGNYDGDPKDFDAREFLASCSSLGRGQSDRVKIHADFLIGSARDAWRQMEQIKKDGLARSIGVSNFSTESLKEVLAVCKIPPAIIQLELHPYSIAHYLPTLVPLCEKHNIKLSAYGPLMSLVRHKGGLVDEVVRRVVKERALSETEGQVLLRWNQETTRGIVVTTSSKPERMSEQIRPFLLDMPEQPLTDDHRDAISQAGQSEPFRFWGQGYPYFMKGEGGFVICDPAATHRKKPNINGGRGW